MTEVKKEPLFTAETPVELKKDAGPTLQPEFDNVTAMIEEVLRETRDRFQAMSDQIIHRIDEMTKRVDNLEKNITELMASSDSAAGDSDGDLQQKQQQQRRNH